MGFEKVLGDLKNVVKSKVIRCPCALPGHRQALKENIKQVLWARLFEAGLG